MKKKSVMSPKTALMTSVLSMLLCITMFVGTTYAWFSAGVTNTQNNIMAGTLDVALEYYDTSMITPGSTNGNWVEVTEDTKIFDPDAKYEPGYTEVVYLRVVNKGSLALKYQLGVSVNSEQFGINQNGVQFKLSDYIMFGVADTDVGENTYQFSAYNKTDADRKAARDSVADSAEIIGLGYRSKPAVLNADTNKIDYLTMVVYMPETVGNEANAQPGKEASINLAIDLFAAQTEYEDDSFGIGYDKDAVLNTVLPAARVNKSSISAVDATLGIGGALQPFDLDAAFKFATTDTATEAQNSAYRYWHADFVVSADKTVAANSMALAGYYAAYCDGYNHGDWVALVSDQDIPANQEIRLLKMLLPAGSMNYEELCEWVPTFDCGVADLSDGDNDGTTLTVELRLYEMLKNSASVDDETGKYVTIGVYKYTFGDKKPPEAIVNVLDQAQLNALPDMTGIVRPDGSTGSSTARLEAAYEYYAKETPAQAADSLYADWKADFVISFSRDVAADEIGLAGSYQAFNGGEWIAFTTPEAFAAGETIRMLQYGSAAWSNGDPNAFYLTYEGLTTLMGSDPFRCGVFAGTPAASGVTATVQLVLFETVEDANGNLVETGSSVVVDTQVYTFA